VAVVTGASGKLGPLWIETLLQAGASVFALDHPAARHSEAGRALEDRFGSQRFALHAVDVRDRAGLEEACGACLARFGAVDALVNSAGIDQPPGCQARPSALEDIPFEVCAEIMSVNALGLFQSCQVFGREMVRQGRGSIVNIGSLYAGLSPDARYYDHIPQEPPFIKPPAYGASKAAVVNLSRYLATHWGPRGVRVNVLSPGGVEGGQDLAFRQKFCARVPLGRMAALNDMKGPLVFLVSSASAYVTGQELVVDGGYGTW
ncbi:MAG: SDR family oxidoreductase, partial [Humidesulfovibrio sp.]|nr:SDR family oxidoreductase [Humidesulfovibrio sp.]